MRFILALFFALCLFGLNPAFAQNAAVAQKVEDALKQTETKKLSDEDLKTLIQTLEDPDERKDFLTKLKALQAVQQTQKEQVSPSSVQALDAVSKAVVDASSNLSTVIKSFADLPQASRWLERQWQSEEARQRWIAIFAQAASALIAGGVAFFFLQWALRIPRKKIATLEIKAWPMKLLALVGYHFLALMPVIAFTVASLFTLNFFELPKQADKAMSAFLSAFIVQQALVWFMQIVFAERVPRLRFIPLADESAAYLFIWCSRLAALIIFGYFMAQAAFNLGVPPGSVHAFASLIGLVVTLMVIIIVLQNRHAVTAWIRGKASENVPKNFWQSTRERLADLWHILAIVYLSVGFLIATLNIDEGFTTLLRATIVTLITLTLFRFLLRGIDRLVSHGFALPQELKLQFPFLEQRTNSYLPLLQRAIKALAWIIGGLIVLSAWGFDTAAWFATPLGKKVVSATIAIALTLLVTTVLWEVVNNFVDRFLQGRDPTGQIVERSARMRTLLPLLRHALDILLVIIAGFIILSELGVDITPLLAGAGIIGLAIGFGAQTLVKDFITGLFILLEDTISVGDFVLIGSVHKGVVEAMTIRTLRLRDVEGQVHSIPFSEVTSVINKTKIYAYVLIKVGVSYQVDLRKVMQVMNEVCEGMRQDPEFRYFIFEPMQMLGVEKFDSSSIIIQARIKTEAQKQWSIHNEYLLRLKDAFDREGIEIPYPTTYSINKHIGTEVTSAIGSTLPL